VSRLVGLLGQPVAESLSPRMQSAAFAAAGLDWEYVLLEVGPEGLREAVARVAEDFVGANVTIPHKRAVVELCDEAEGDSVNTLVIRDGRVLGYNTDKEIVAGIDAQRVCLIGAGGAARALLPGLSGEVRVFSRSGEWPPDASGADLIVNATRGPSRPSSTWRITATGARPRWLPLRGRPVAASSSTGSRRSCARAPPRSSSGPASTRLLTRCGPP
jgi:Shikimate dehydrogenase substrate binding domain